MTKSKIIFAACAGVAALSVAPASADTDTVVTHDEAKTAAQQQAVQDYWTPERIAALTQPSSDNPPKSGPDGAPWTASDAISRAVGRLFFTDHGEDVSCTATIVDSANRSTVVTAGHCVHNTDLLGENGQWTQNVLFVPGYHDGQAPYGRFTGRIGVADATWLRDDAQHPDVYGPHDQAFVVLNANERGQRAADAAGASQHIGFDMPTGGTAAEFGYPRASSDDARQGLPEYTGARLAYCEGSQRQNPGDAAQWGVACTMGGGSSGGPRFADLAHGSGTVVGDNTEGPYLDDAGKPCTAGDSGCTRYLVGPRFTGEITEPLYTRAETAW